MLAGWEERRNQRYSRANTGKYQRIYLHIYLQATYLSTYLSTSASRGSCSYEIKLSYLRIIDARVSIVFLIYFQLLNYILR